MMKRGTTQELREYIRKGARCRVDGYEGIIGEISSTFSDQWWFWSNESNRDGNRSPSHGSQSAFRFSWEMNTGDGHTIELECSDPVDFEKKEINHILIYEKDNQLEYGFYSSMKELQDQIGALVLKDSKNLSIDYWVFDVQNKRKVKLSTEIV